MRILFLAFEVPYPLDRGGRIKTFHYLEALARNHEVSLVALTRSQDCVEKLEHLRVRLPLADVHGVPIDLSRFRKARLALNALWRAEPFVMSLYANAEGKRLVERLLNDGHVDLVYADHLHMAQYVPIRQAQGRPSRTRAVTLLDQHNVESVVLQRFADRQSFWPLRWFAHREQRKMSRYEAETCRRFDAIWVTTEVDRELISPWLLPRQHIEVLPIGVDTGYFQPVSRKPDPHTVISVGTLSWPPNADSVLWFYGEIFSAVRRRVPDTKFVIVGANPPPAIQRLAEDTCVEVTGWVDDIRPTMARSTVMVVPLRGGSGMRVKILNALAMGLPVVSTPVGCEGIAVTPGDDILVADDADTFTEQIVALFEDRPLQRRLLENGVRLIQERYSWDAVYRQIESSVAAIWASFHSSRAVGGPQAARKRFSGNGSGQ
jgi:sugar transferase (PEP-CTERM/EpsH1 system associated)